MKTPRLLVLSSIVTAAVTLALFTGGHFAAGARRVEAAGGAAFALPQPAIHAMPLGLPSERDAKRVLSTSLATHHPLWVDVPMGAVKIRTVVLYPDLAGTAPVVVITAKNEGLSDWVRAVGTEVVSQGLIAVVPDLLSGTGPRGGGSDSFASPAATVAASAHLGSAEIERRTNAVRDYFLGQPGSNGKSAILEFDWSANRLDAVISTTDRNHVARFDLTQEHAWHNALPLLMNLASPPSPQATSGQGISQEPYAAASKNQSDAQKEIASRKDMPTQAWYAKEMADQSPRHGEWIDIPITTTREGPIKMHTWVVQPLGNEKAGVVVVIQPSPGMDLGEEPHKGSGANWMRAVADQVALRGFIVVMPDLTSGMGPNGGNFDSFVYSDDQMNAEAKRPVSERMEFVRAARDYGLKLPRANGRSATLGFCSGGGLSWQAAAEVPGLSAAVVFYGAPPNLETMAKIHAPVIAFAGDQDPGLAPRVQAAAPDMQRLGKTFEYKIYPGTTHAYLYEQHLGQNAAASLDSWPRSMEFLKRYLNAA